MEIIQERLYREFDMDVITTVPNVSYRITTTQGEVVEVHNPSGLPEITKVAKIEEPYILAQIITKADFLGNVIKLCIDKRGVLKNQTFITTDRVEINFDMPLSEIVFDFYDKLKSISKATPRSTTTARAINSRSWSSWTSCSTASRSTRSRRSPTPTTPTISAARCAKTQGADPAPAVRHRHSGSYRRQDHRPRNGEGRAQGRDGQVLRRRHLAQAQAARKTEGRARSGCGRSATWRCRSRPSSPC